PDVADAGGRLGARVLLSENDLFGDAGRASAPLLGPADAAVARLAQGGFPFATLGDGVDVIVQAAQMSEGAGQLFVQPGGDLLTEAFMLGREIAAHADLPRWLRRWSGTARPGRPTFRSDRPGAKRGGPRSHRRWLRSSLARRRPGRSAWPARRCPHRHGSCRTSRRRRRCLRRWCRRLAAPPSDVAPMALRWSATGRPVG